MEHAVPRDLGAAPAVQASRSAAADQDVLDIRFIFFGLLRGWWLLFLFVAIGGALGVDAIRSYPQTFTASLVVGPHSGEGGGAVDAISAVAQSIGIRAESQAQPTAWLELMLGSPALAETVEAEFGLLRVVFGEAWNEETRTWRRPQGWRFQTREDLRALLNLPGWTEPSVATLQVHLASAITLTPIDGTEFVRVQYSNADPQKALLVLETAFRSADELIRGQDTERIAEQRRYIQERLAQTQLLDQREVLMGMLGQVEQKAMLLNSGSPYTVRLLEAPWVNTQPEARGLTAEIGGRMFVAFLLGAVLVILYQLFRRESDRSA